jgi:transposase
MKVPQTIIGADLSKDSIDLAFCPGNSYLKIDNSTAGFRLLLKWLRDQRISISSVMIVMEHTGLYSYHMESFLHTHHISFTKVSALAIKRSMGLIRGKSDKIDAQRIARYGYEKQDRLTAATTPDKDLQRLQMLHSTRERMVKHRTSLICALHQYRSILKQSDVMIKSQMTLIKGFTGQIKKIEEEIQKVLRQNPCLKQNDRLLQTIIGVGPVLSIATVVKTKNFSQFTDPRKFACYCGTAPFEHSSGKSIRKRTRVSHLADKTMKTLLDQSAKSAIQYDKELRDYYQRRLEMGKSKKSTINIVRNKILYRMFAVIKRQTPFIKNYLQTA